MLFYSYMIIVPVCYIKIYLFRHNQAKPGEQGSKSTKADIHKKKRNIVTFKYNISIWLFETITVSFFKFHFWRKM